MQSLNRREGPMGQTEEQDGQREHLAALEQHGIAADQPVPLELLSTPLRDEILGLLSDEDRENGPNSPEGLGQRG
jgi:hypothetical protein